MGPKTKDHFPLSLCLRVPQPVVNVQASDDEYMGASLQKVDWGQLPVDIMSNYMHMTDTLLSDLVLPDDVIACSGGKCANQCHVNMISNTYECIMKCLQRADEMCIHRKNKKHFTPVPGWNEYLSQPYDESRQAYIIWNSYNRHRSGPVHELMKRTRARFKYAQRLVQKNEDMLRADALGKKLSAGDAKCFRKNVKNCNSGTVDNSNQIEMHLVLIISWVCGMTITSHCSTRSKMSMISLVSCHTYKTIWITKILMLKSVIFQMQSGNSLMINHLESMALCLSMSKMHPIS